MHDVAPYLKAFVAIYVLVNPLEGIPFFLANTQRMDRTAQLGIARQASLTVLILLIVSFFAGREVLEFFSISLPAFTCAGGLIILIIALKMVLGGNKETGGAASTASANGGSSPPVIEGSFAIVPLGTPLLCGPGPISAVILYASNGVGGHRVTLFSDLLLVGIIVIVGFGTFFALAVAGPAVRLLKETGIEVLTRISGILIAAIAMQMMLEGLGKLLPGLVH